MNVLEKILEEIEERIKKVNEADNMCRVNAERNRNFESVKYFQSLMFSTERAESIIGDIIRSHMDEVENAEIEPVSKEFLKDCAKTAKRYKRNNDGWIPVGERLPEVPEGLADEYCPEFNVTIKGAERTTTLKYSWDGTWFDDNGNVYNVIAWQPLPAPYKPKKNIPVAGMDHIMSGFTKVE